MRSFHFHALAFAGVLLASTSLQAQSQNSDHYKSSDNYTRQGNVPPPKAGTSEERKTARQAQRAVVKQQAKSGQIPNVGESSGQSLKPEKVAGTHETRSAERKEKRAELKVANKAGQIPITNEAVVGKVKSQ